MSSTGLPGELMGNARGWVKESQEIVSEWMDWGLGNSQRCWIMDGNYGDIKGTFPAENNLTRGLCLTTTPPLTLLHVFNNTLCWPGVYPWGKRKTCPLRARSSVPSVQGSQSAHWGPKRELVSWSPPQPSPCAAPGMNSRVDWQWLLYGVLVHSELSGNYSGTPR